MSDGLGSVSHDVIAAAIEVHRLLGPGLLERTYEECLAHELGLRGKLVRRQVLLPIAYKDISLPDALRLDLVVEEEVVVEVKAVEAVLPVHRAQLLTYLKLSGYPVGLLLNFHVPVFRGGITRLIRTGARRC